MSELELVDTHCHVHMDGYKLSPEETVQKAQTGGVTRLICVGTDAVDSQRAVNFARTHKNCWASVGLHPHDAKLGQKSLEALRRLLEDDKSRAKIVAIGECGLDYYYNHSPKSDQEAAFRSQLELASEFNLPLIFHVREAFADFWQIMADFPSVRGVVHSFSSGVEELELILARGLYVGLNGIMTFSKDERQLAGARAVVLDKLLLETDAPFLTPVPQRGRVNEPRYLALIAQFLAELRQDELANVAKATTANAIELFALKTEK